MSKINLNGSWQLKDTKDLQWLTTLVPGTVFATILEHGLVPDPYYRDNEDAVQDFFRSDYEYKCEFDVNETDLNSDEIMLVCEGIDTLADIYINNSKVAQTENMHRTYRFDVRNLLHVGVNEIRIIIRSAKNFVAERAPHALMPSILGVTGVEQLRKAQCQFGWDWGLCLPDMGIWRDIYIECNNTAKIEDFYITQRHAENEVTLEIDVTLKSWTDKPLTLVAELSEPDGGTFAKSIDIVSGNDLVSSTMKITDPKLWWPSGYGKQPLYNLTLTLIYDKQTISTRNVNIGLRTIELRRETDEYGQSYEFIVNGEPLFLRGSNLIIEDAILSRRSRERTKRMLLDCKKANFNCVRVWGGGIYPEDYFFDICDELGLLVYQDFMFSCHIYPATDDFIENISCEIADNVRRIRHHACLALWSGNNEIETIIELYLGNDELIAPISERIRQVFGFDKPDAELEARIKDDYLALFDRVIPGLLKDLDPNTNHTRSSPCIKDEPFAPLSKGFSNGDSHFYIYAAGLTNHKDQRNMFFRFASEIGFQSYPSMKTIRTFAEEDDLGPYTTIMLKHQKAARGNQTIEAYMGREFNLPTDFGLYVYTSQIMAGEVQRYIAEHLRRNRGRCMGIITWQLNDCWSVVSWAGLDYYGRWKAQQYYSKRFFAPVLLSCNENGAKADIYLTNDTFDKISGRLSWALKDNHSNTVIDSSCEVNIDKLSALNCVSLDFAEMNCGFNPNLHYIEYRFTTADSEVYFGTTIFVPAKEFVFIDPQISFLLEEMDNAFRITLESKTYARHIALDLETDDCVFSDNFFDMSGHDPRIITVEKADMSKALSLDDFKNQLKIRSVYDLQ